MLALAKEHVLDVLGIALAAHNWDFGRAVLTAPATNASCTSEPDHL